LKRKVNLPQKKWLRNPEEGPWFRLRGNVPPLRWLDFLNCAQRTKLKSENLWRS
jgi:hypothetical protein